MGSYTSLADMPPSVFTYLRAYENERFLIALNFSAEAQAISYQNKQGKIVFSTFLDRREEITLQQFTLRGNEGILIELKES